MDERIMSAFCKKPRGGGGGGGGGGFGGGCGCDGGGTTSRRWNPTREQVKVLTDLFESGLQNPNGDQIRKITSKLSIYGEIENKNVGIWFQNHKARERKRRRTNPNSEDTSQVQEPAKVIQTLQLFPLQSTESEKQSLFASDCKEITSFLSSIETQKEHLQLDLRLSFP